MIHFNEIQYSRPDASLWKQNFKNSLQLLKEATNEMDFTENFDNLNQLRVDFDARATICSIRHSIDTKDSFYENENLFFDETYPELQELIIEFQKTVLQSPFRTNLEKKLGKQYFIYAEESVKSFLPEIVDELKEENKLSTRYNQIKAKAEINYKDKTYNLSSIAELESSTDRETRKDSQELKWNFFETHAPDIEKIYDDLVGLRHSMAIKLGYKNYIELGYARMKRSDYDASMVAGFRQQILEEVLPLCNELYQRQSKRLNIENMAYYDYSLMFLSGNPFPKGDESWMREKASQMYGELSKETDVFFQMMLTEGLMDLPSREGKMNGGYCTFIPGIQKPFIFSNFNNTSHDVTVLTHEAGHAFQCYQSRNLNYDCIWPTYEACEIHSMSMEFFTWPWMHLFFQEDTDKFLFEHLSAALLFLPYGCAVDEFQHEVYLHPELSTEERNRTWRKIEKKYLPHRSYPAGSFLDKGGFWQKQSHIFSSPFYYIDYVLAQICAFQFWQRSKDSFPDAWSSYLHLCSLGGSKSFLELVNEAGLNNPFEAGTVKKAMQPVIDFLKNIDDSKL